MMVTVASRALAAQISFPSSDTSNPSAPLPAGTLVTFQVIRGRPAGGPYPWGGPPADAPATPCGGPKFDWDVCSMMLIVPELTFDVKIRSRLLETTIMGERSSPVPKIQS